LVKSVCNLKILISLTWYKPTVNGYTRYKIKYKWWNIVAQYYLVDITSRETDIEQHGSWSDCVDVQAGLDPCWSQTHYIGFFMTRLKCKNDFQVDWYIMGTMYLDIPNTAIIIIQISRSMYLTLTNNIYMYMNPTLTNNIYVYPTFTNNIYKYPSFQTKYKGI
jgi:hypothetical protein